MKAALIFQWLSVFRGNPKIFSKDTITVSWGPEKYPDRIKAFVCFDLFSRRAAREFERCVKNGASEQESLLFYADRPDKMALENIQAVEHFWKSSLPVLIHAMNLLVISIPENGFTPEPAYIILQKNFLKNRIIFAHWAEDFFFIISWKEKSVMSLKMYIWTQPRHLFYTNLKYIMSLKIFGADRILFGSDYPLKTFQIFWWNENPEFLKKTS